ncbi:MAG: Hsp20/alpha crystallin family protein [Cyclobacteriaceae bacterium]
MKLAKRNEGTFPGLWNSFFDDDWFGVPNVVQAGTSVPAVNVKETDNDYNIEMAVPGMKKDDFHVDLDNQILTVSCEQKSETKDEDADGKYTRKEFNYSSFMRSFTLPNSTENDKVSASYKDGLLKVHIPKKEEAKPKPVKTIKIS